MNANVEAHDYVSLSFKDKQNIITNIFNVNIQTVFFN